MKEKNAEVSINKKNCRVTSVVVISIRNSLSKSVFWLRNRHIENLPTTTDDDRLEAANIKRSFKNHSWETTT